MNKSKKFLIFAIYFTILILIFLLCIFIFTEDGNDIALTMFAPKYYIKFDDLKKVTICYNPDEIYPSIERFPELENIPYCEFEVTDEEFLKLIEDTYQNKIFTNYHTGGILGKGSFSIIVSDNFQISTSTLGGFRLDYKDKYIKTAFNEKIFEATVQMIINNYNNTEK